MNVKKKIWNINKCCIIAIYCTLFLRSTISSLRFIYLSIPLDYLFVVNLAFWFMIPLSILDSPFQTVLLRAFLEGKVPFFFFKSRSPFKLFSCCFSNRFVGASRLYESRYKSANAKQFLVKRNPFKIKSHRPS